MIPSHRDRLESAAIRTRTDRLQAVAAEATAYVYASQHRRFTFVGERHVRGAAQAWIGTLEATLAAGATEHEAHGRADATARESMSWTLWLLAGELILKLLWAWWSNRNPQDRQT